MQVRGLVRVADDPTFGRLGFAPRRGLEAAFRRGTVLQDAIQRLLCEIQARAVVLELLRDTDALLVVTEPLGQKTREQLLADVAEWRVADVVAERHRLDKILVEPERTRDRAADLIHLEDVREPRSVVIADRSEEDLRLVLGAPEGL